MLVLQDCRHGLARLGDGTLDAVITDPPYCLASLGDDWDSDGAAKTTRNSVIGHLPGGMAFRPEQSREVQELIYSVAEAAYAKLKPGGWFLAFSAPRLIHRMATGIEEAGFDIRDQWAWLYRQSRPKGMSLKRFMSRLDFTGWTQAQIDKLSRDLDSWKTPQIKCVGEPIVVAQKPRDGSYMENWLRHGVGLLCFDAKLAHEATPSSFVALPDEDDGELPLSGIVEVPKPVRKYRNADEQLCKIAHLSPKPLAMMEHLIRLTVPKGGTVCDPFTGSGSTGLAALSCGRNFVGFEREKPYFDLAVDRFRGEFIDENLSFRSVRGQKGVWATDNALARRLLESSTPEKIAA